MKTIKSNMTSSIPNMKSFIECIHYIKLNLPNYKNNGKQLLIDIYYILEPRIHHDDHPLINNYKLYENVVYYTQTQWTRNDIDYIKQLITKYKKHKYYNDVILFLNQMNFEDL